MSMHKGETLKAYSDGYWEMFNEVDRAYDDVAINTFKVGLPTKHDPRKSLTGKPVTNVCQLMDQIDKYKRVEEDQIQGRGKSKVVPQEMRNFRSDRYNNNRPWKDFGGQPGSANSQVVNVVFQELVQRVLEKIKGESFFRWPNRMVGDPVKHNQNLYCQYHRDHGHTTKDCRNLWDHLDQLVRKGKLTQLLHHSSGRGSQAGLTFRKDASSRPPLGTIYVIFAAPGRTGSYSSRTSSDMVEVDFIVVDAFSPYTAILGRPWLHTLGDVSSTLHQKVKYPSGGQVLEILGNQTMARQCLIMAIQHRPETDISTTAENDL
nr:uncharacterized protein LOC112038027 [Quercus suber]